MRTYGRLRNSDGSPGQWIEVQTDTAGYDDYVWITTLAQYLKLNLGESPFFGDAGLPAKQSVIQQIAPDYYVALAQQRFAPYFASLIISKQPTLSGRSLVYQVNITTQQGVKIAMSVPV